MKTWWKRFSSPQSPDMGGGRAPGLRGASAVSAPVAGPDGGALVDAHVHVFPPDMIRERETYAERDPRFDALYRSPSARMATAEEVVAQMDTSGVEVSVLVGFAFGDQGLCRLVNDYVLDAVRAHPGRLAGLACVSPEAPGATAELERCLDAGLNGCGELAPKEEGPGLRAVGGCLRERGLPLLVHASEPVGHHYPGKGLFTPANCLALAQACPGLTIVFAHLGGGLFLYEMMPEVREALVGVFYDTAAVPFLYGPGIYEVAMLSAGPGKLIFGSDYPLLNPERYEDGLKRLSSEARAATQTGNAHKVFKL